MAESSTVSFADLLRQLRTDAGMTQEELAEAAGLSARSISDLERRISLTPRRDTARLLAGALGLAGAARSEFELVARGRTGAGVLSARPGGSVGGLAAATRTLPRDAASFTGRQAELTRLTEAASSATDRGEVVSIHAIGGMAGIGKTTFAIRAAHLLAPRFPDGQIFLPLHGHTPGQRPVDPAEAVASLLQTAGVAAPQVPRGLDARVRMWRDYLAGKRVLIVLDDAIGHEQVRPLLPGTPGSLVLVTSRRHLTALEDALAMNLDILPPDDAAQLLIRLAARPGLHPGNPAVAEITLACGYLPLAIGLLARQLHHHPGWSAADLAADLTAARGRLELMQAENLSVAAAFDLSYGDLTVGQQRLFRRLGLHPGTDIDAYAAAALDTADLRATRRELEALYDQHLLTQPAHGRYRLHDLIREHAQVLSASDPPADRETATRRLLDYYVHTTRSADTHLARRKAAGIPAVIVGPPPHAPEFLTWPDAVAWMNAEVPNLYAAADYARVHERPAVTIAISAAMHGFLRSQGQFDHAPAFHNAALSAALILSDHLAEASALTDLGDTHRLSGNYAAAAELLSRAADLYRAAGQRLGEANALNELGAARYHTHDYQAAALDLARALDLYRSLGDRLGEAQTINHIGAMHHLTDDYPAALASHDEALRLYGELGYLIGQANATNEIGVVHRLTGNYRAALASQTRALELARALGSRTGEMDALIELGAIQAGTGDPQAAVSTLTTASERSQELGYRLAEACALHYLGMVQHNTGEHDQAQASMTRSLQLYRDLSNRLGEARVLNAIGESSPPDKAAASHQQALTIATAVSSPAEQARALEGLGRCHLHKREHDQAAELLRQALTAYRRIGSPRADQLESALQNQMP